MKLQGVRLVNRFSLSALSAQKKKKKEKKEGKTFFSICTYISGYVCCVIENQTDLYTSCISLPSGIDGGSKGDLSR